MSFSPRIQFSADLGGMTNYVNALRSVGAQPVGGYCPAPDLTCAGLLLCGGGDLDCALFGQENRGSDPPDPARDAAELALFNAFLAAQRPILGICRGMQLINVALGGTLIQDLPPQTRVFHSCSGRDLVHPLRTAPDSIIAALYGSHLQVNSSHHQAVDAIGEGLIPTAWSESGIVEVLEHRELPILGVQFHPERMSFHRCRPDTADAAAILNRFIDQCRLVP